MSRCIFLWLWALKEIKCNQTYVRAEYWCRSTLSVPPWQLFPDFVTTPGHQLPDACRRKFLGSFRNQSRETGLSSNQADILGAWLTRMNADHMCAKCEVKREVGKTLLLLHASPCLIGACVPRLLVSLWLKICLQGWRYALRQRSVPIVARPVGLCLAVLRMNSSMRITHLI